MTLNRFYLVSALGGACGAFLSSLIYHWLTECQEEMIFDKYGSCHNMYEDRWIKNWDSINLSDDIFRYNIPTPINKNLPLVARHHALPNIDILNENYESHFNINVTYTADNVELLGILLFFKQDVREFEMGVRDTWNIFKLPVDVLSPHDLTHDEIKLFTDTRAARTVGPGNGPLLAATAIEDPDNTLILTLDDIFLNKDKVLTNLSLVIEKPITSWIEKSYDNYIYANKKIVNDKCPWVTYFN